MVQPGQPSGHRARPACNSSAHSKSPLSVSAKYRRIRGEPCHHLLARVITRYVPSELCILRRQSWPLRELTMKTTAVSLPRLTLPSSSGLTARLGDFVTLMKPRVMLLAVFTALVGLLIAPRHLDPLHAAIAIMAIAAGGGAAGVLNMWYESDIDAAMTRTAKRPIPRGKISRAEALLFGTALAGGAVATLGFALNVVAAALLA